MKEEQLEKVREIALLYLHTPIEKNKVRVSGESSVHKQ